MEVDGGRIYCEVDGSGHPLLLIHGDLGSRRMWDDQVPALAQCYRVIRYDRRGFGRSETADVEFSNRGAETSYPENGECDDELASSTVTHDRPA